jgi:hypothetical protein
LWAEKTGVIGNNSLFYGESDSDDNAKEENENVKQKNISDSSLLVDKDIVDIVPNDSSFLSPQKNVFNEKVNEKFYEARLHLLSFLNNLETAYVGVDGKLEKDEHFIVDPTMKPLKFTIKSKEAIDRYRGFLQKPVSIHFYTGFYNDLYTDPERGNEYVKYMNASKDDILQNPTFLRLFVAVVGMKEVLDMKSLNNDPEKYTVNLINPFPLTTQAKSLIFGPQKQPHVRIICQYLGELNALELTSQQKEEEIFNSTINDITDKNITLEERELIVEYFMLFNQTPRNLRNFFELCVQSKFRIKNKGKHNLIKEYHLHTLFVDITYISTLLPYWNCQAFDDISYRIYISMI